LSSWSLNQRTTVCPAYADRETLFDVHVL